MYGQRTTGRTHHAKVVYWGPQGSGKTATLLNLRRFLDGESKTRVYSVNADSESTLFFDLFHLDEFHLGTNRIRTRILTGPGAVNRSETRRTLLAGANAVIFVADARRSALSANRDSLSDLEASLHAAGIHPGSIPIVFAFNHQDSQETVPTSELTQLLPVGVGQTVHETVATTGAGVFETFAETFRLTVDEMATRMGIEDIESSLVIPSRLMQKLVHGKVHTMAESTAIDGRVLINVAGEETELDEPPPSAACPQLGEYALEAQILLAETNVALQARGRRLEERNHELMAINRVAHSILGAMEAENLLVVLLDSTAEYLSATHATCVVFDGAGGENLRTHVRGFGRDPILGLPPRHAQAFLDLVGASDGPIPLQPGRNANLLAALRQVDGRVGSAFFAPVKSAGHPAGWIGIYQVGDERPLNTRELLFLSSISRLAALGLEKIGFLEEMQKFTASQEEDMQDRNARLEVANAKIRALNRGIESKVAERTRELEARNRTLREEKGTEIASARIGGMGEIAGAFAHEVNSPIAGLKDNLDSMRDSLDDLRARVAVAGEEAADGLKAIEEFEQVIEESVQSTERISGVIASLKRFGGEEDEQETFSLNAAVADAATLLEERFQACATVDLRLGTVPEIKGESLGLSQAVLALMSNALEGCERKGGTSSRVEVTTFMSGDQVTLMVKDTGCGISSEILPRVFEPFVSTKKGQPNAGLGLHTAYQAIQRHNGRIRLRSKELEGTKVTVSLPVHGGAET